MSNSGIEPGGDPQDVRGDETYADALTRRDDRLAGYRLRTVRIGTWTTWLTLFALAGFVLLPGHGPMHSAWVGALLLSGAAGAIVVALAPWRRMFESSLGQWAMYLWAAFDIILISGAVAATGGGRSEVWCVFALTTLFIAASYPVRDQAALLGFTALGYTLALWAAGWHVTAGPLLLRASLLLIVFLMARFLARELRLEIELRGQTALRAQLAESEARRTQWFRALVQDSADVVTSFDVEGVLLYVSAAAREFGYDPDSLIGTNVRTLVHPDDVDRVVEKITEQIETGSRATPIEYRIRCADGSWRYAEGIATNLLEEPTVNAVVVNARDVTARKRAELLAASQGSVLSRIAAGARIEEVLGLVRVLVEDLTGARCTIVVNGPDAAARIEGPDDSDSGWSREIMQGDCALLGAVRLHFASPRFATSDDRQVAEVAANLTAIALERDAAESRLAHQARHDSLTGLANRQVLVNTLEHALTSASSHETIAVLFVDLDGFKEINDNFGHHIGDQVLVALGHRLAAALRMHDVIARFGGDEFVALCRVDGQDEALYLAERILTRVREPITLGANRVNLDASIGVTIASVYSDDGPRWVVNAAWVQAAADELLRQADTAMYRAKQSGGGRTELYVSDPPPKPRLRAAGDDD